MRKLQLTILVLVILLIGWATHRFWISTIGQSLVCREAIRRSDVIIVENFDPTYLLFERVEELQREGFAAKVIVPVEASDDAGGISRISKGVAELMIQVARVRDSEIIPIRELEPISLNAACQIRDFLKHEHVESVIVVTRGFRSKRSSLIYNSVMGTAGIRVYCMPVFGEQTPQNWTKTWHGRQEVAEQFIKLQYYRFFVLPFSHRSHDACVSAKSPLANRLISLVGMPA